MSTLVERLEQAEGNIPHAYQDSEGYWTIGIGRLIDKRLGGGLSKDEIQYLLNNDIKNKTDDCRKLFTDFDSFSQSRREALIELMFNIGYSKFKTYDRIIAQINKQDWNGVQANIKGWSRWIAQVKEARANRIINALGE
jgi:lysozyme